MSQTKRFLEDISIELGHEGAITGKVLKVARKRIRKLKRARAFLKRQV